MKRMALYIGLFVVGIFPFSAHAVLPPDVIYSVGTQLYATLAGVGVFILGSILAVVPFIKGLFGRVWTPKVGLPLLGIICLFGASLFLFYSLVNVVEAPSPFDSGPKDTSTTTSTSAQHRFFADRFVVIGKRDAGEKFLLNLDVNRKERVDGAFEHYYLGKLLTGNDTWNFYENRTASGTEVLPDLFFSRFQAEEAADHSARDTFTFSFMHDGKAYTVVTEELSADFLTKNTPEYTWYTSAGKASVSIDGISFPAQVMYQKTYSTDYRPTIFFEGGDTLSPETTQLVLWNEKGDFYFVDNTVVDQTHPAYASHFWALKKTTEGMMYKSFEGSARKENGEEGVSFASSIPAFENTNISLGVVAPMERPDEGWVEGTLTNGGIKEFVYGLGYHHVWNK